MDDVIPDIGDEIIHNLGNDLMGVRLSYSREVLPPGLSMLWEKAEPEDALRTRFGFSGLAAVADWVVTILAEEWEITATQCTTTTALPMS